VTEGAGWLGRLSLELDKTEHGTQLSRSAHEGPLRIQRVLRPEGPQCPHIYLLHPPGGVVGGDRLQTRVTLGAGAQVLLTTPAAQKLYRSQGDRAQISNLLEVASGGRLEWLPSETLAFSAAQALLTTRVELAPAAAFIGWDIACYGMPARGETFDAGRVLSRFELFRGDQPLAIESFDLGRADTESELLSAAFALRGEPVVANLYAVPANGQVDPAVVERVRAAIGEPVRGLFSVSSLGELLVVRALGPHVEGVRESLIRAWAVLRPIIVGRDAIPPRIWAT
jgi:urease accessory protein